MNERSQPAQHTTDDSFDPATKGMLDRAMSHFHMVTNMYRMGLGEQLPPHPVSDAQYQRAMEQSDEEAEREASHVQAEWIDYLVMLKIERQRAYRARYESRYAKGERVSWMRPLARIGMAP